MIHLDLLFRANSLLGVCVVGVLGWGDAINLELVAVLKLNRVNTF